MFNLLVASLFPKHVPIHHFYSVASFVNSVTEKGLGKTRINLKYFTHSTSHPLTMNHTNTFAEFVHLSVSPNFVSLIHALRCAASSHQEIMHSGLYVKTHRKNIESKIDNTFTMMIIINYQREH